MQIFVRGLDRTAAVDVAPGTSVLALKACVEGLTAIPAAAQRLLAGRFDLEDGTVLADYPSLSQGSTLTLLLRLRGGIDFQHREGSKFGGGGVMSETQVRRSVQAKK